LIHTINTGSHLKAVDNLNFRLNTPKLQTTKYLLSLPKKQLRILVSLITGHCYLNKHLHRMGLATSPVCASYQLGEGTSFYVCLSNSCNIENTHFWQAHTSISMCSIQKTILFFFCYWSSVKSSHN
jgi:hypothetical protein